jgi:hypothetical protein
MSSDVPLEVTADPKWQHMDCTMRSWLYGIVSPDLIEITSTGVPTASSIWLSLEDQFVGNKGTRAMILDAEFHTFVQGELSISAYCCHLKGMADALNDLGKVVLDCTLLLAMLRGLNNRFSHMASLLKWQRPFPTFTEVRNDLHLEGIEMAARPDFSASALVTTTAAGGHTTPAASAPPPAPHPPAPSVPNKPSTPTTSKNNNQNRRNNNNNGNNQRTTNYSLPTTANLWNVMLQLWAGATAAYPGLLGAHPGSHQTLRP